MLFVNFTSLIDGKLLNEPSIASFSNIVYEVKKIKIGDLFIGKKSEVKSAIELGAYGIVSTNIKVKDDEIAWIEVHSIEQTKLKLLRYFIIKSSLPLLYLSDVEYEILTMIVDKSTIIKLEDSSEEVIKKLQHSSCTKLIVTTDKKMLSSIDVKPYNSTNTNNIDIIKYTIFLTTFRYRDNYYKDLKFPRLFIDELKNILGYLDSLNIGYNLYNLSFIKHFRPLFIDSYFKIKSFGQSTKVLILESDKALIPSAMEYIDKNAPWANVALVMPKESKTKLKATHYYKDYSDINSINISNLNFIVIYDKEQKYEEYLIKKSSEDRNSLF